LATDFKEILARLERPYWSPLHPRQYIKRDERTGYRLGWGCVYPEDIGAFNLLWLLSGAGAPPDDYSRYTPGLHIMLKSQHMHLGRHTLKEAAALLPLDRFADHVFFSENPQLAPVAAALRLRV